MGVWGIGPSVSRRRGPQLAVDRVLAAGDRSGDRRHRHSHLPPRLCGRTALLVREAHDSGGVPAGRAQSQKVRVIIHFICFNKIVESNGHPILSTRL